MNHKKWRIFQLCFCICIFGFGIILLFLNINVISVIHASESEWLPVIKYETYSTLELLLLYVFIVLAASNIIFGNNDKLTTIYPYFNIITLLISIIFVLLLLFNPHLLILNPTGLPPTQLDVIEVGGVLSIILFIALAIITGINLGINERVKSFLGIGRKRVKGNLKF